MTTKQYSPATDNFKLAVSLSAHTLIGGILDNDKTPTRNNPKYRLAFFTPTTSLLNYKRTYIEYLVIP